MQVQTRAAAQTDAGQPETSTIALIRFAPFIIIGQRNLVLGGPYQGEVFNRVVMKLADFWQRELVRATIGGVIAQFFALRA